jgi:hypothetical protein
MQNEVPDMPITRFSDISLDKDDTEKFLAETMATDLALIESKGDTHYCLYPTVGPFGETIACVVNPASSVPTISDHVFSASVPLDRDPKSSMLEVENKEFKRSDPDIEHLVDPIHLGWGRSCAFLYRAADFALRLVHRTHLTCSRPIVKASLESRCVLCKLARDHPDSSSPSHMEDWQQSPATSTVDVPSPIADLTSPFAQHLIAFATQTIIDFYWNIRASYSCKARISAKDMTHYE